MTVKEFMDSHRACVEGRQWAETTCETMHDVWRLARPDWLIWVATRPGVLTDRELRVFAVWSAGQVKHLMTDARSLAALDVAEKHANGQASREELAASTAAAWASSTSTAAAWGASLAASKAAALAASTSTAAAWESQCEWLRSHTAPRFTVQEVTA